MEKSQSTYRLPLYGFIVAVMSLLSGCFYIKMTHLSDEDLEWLKAYGTGLSVFFISNLGSTDTLIVTEKGLWNSTNPFYFSEAGGWTYEANGGFSYYLKHSDTKIRGSMDIKRKLNDTLYFDSHLGTLFQTEPIKIDNDSCMAVNSTNAHYSKYAYDITNRIKEYVWHKKYGLIYYKFEDGEEFFREDLLPDSVVHGNK